MYDFVKANNEYLHLNQSSLDLIKKDSDECGYTTYTRDNLNYPPKGKLPPYNTTGCNAFNGYSTAVTKANPNFNIYRISDIGPTPNNPVGDANSPLQFLHKTFFDNYDLQSYIHAPHKKWNECNSGVFTGNGDTSAPPDETVLAGVIESSKKSIIANGRLDGLILTNGTALALQNLTWSGVQGFEKSPAEKEIVTDGTKAGNYVTERNLTFAIIDKSGHMVPEDTPATGLQLVKFLLGQVDDLSA